MYPITESMSQKCRYGLVEFKYSLQKRSAANAAKIRRIANAPLIHKSPGGMRFIPTRFHH